MTLSLSGVFADAGAMWRSQRDILSALAGVFFVVPMLGILFLMAQSGLPTDPDPVKLNEAVRKFYEDNLLWFLLANLLIDFGTFTILILFLQPGTRTLGETMTLALRRLLPLVVIDVLCSILFGIGFSLFVLPGLFVFGRTWLAAPALAANPDQGILGAFRQGWQRSFGFRWVVLLAAMAMTVLTAAVAILLASRLLLGLLVMAAGDNQFIEMAGYVLIALLGGFAWVTLVLIRVSAYRRTEPSTGI
ncbi:hypothetical protein [Sphingomonas soli]|uniref:hypothetical protein n=1 Tax=Sphingomonas soli TaxID=266127 RepID=UPI000832CD3E|nr:hypothetical protein [Sphingomonas soli]